MLLKHDRCRKKATTGKTQNATIKGATAIQVKSKQPYTPRRQSVYNIVRVHRNGEALSTEERSSRAEDRSSKGREGVKLFGRECSPPQQLEGLGERCKRPGNVERFVSLQTRSWCGFKFWVRAKTATTKFLWGRSEPADSHGIGAYASNANVSCTKLTTHRRDRSRAVCRRRTSALSPAFPHTAANKKLSYRRVTARRAISVEIKVK